MRHLTKYLVVALIAVRTFLPVPAHAQSGRTVEADQIKQAQKHFDDKNYDKALPIYSQIVSNQPDNALYNYYLGVCLLKVDGDKADAVRFLTIAKQSSEVPFNSLLYLGMALHQAYRFDEAIATLQTYRNGAGKQSWKDSGGEQLIQMCRNAINLNNDLSLPRHSILNEQEINCVDFVSSYKNTATSGRFLKLPKEYESKQSQEKSENKLLFLTAKGDMMVYSGPGKSGLTGSDIFVVTKDEKGLWRFPESISPLINSSSDEAYPVLVNDGKTLYFSSKGNKSIGGYDVFRSDFDVTTASWSEPVPMGSPVNSPGNDFYYVPLAAAKTACFSSDRESPAGKCKVYTASVIDEDRSFVAINGTFVCPAGLDLSDAKVTILNAGDRSLLAQFRTSTQNGTYFLKLPVPSQLIYQVKLPGFNDLESEVNLTEEGRVKLLQEIFVKRDDKGKESVRITTKIPEVMPEMMVKNASGFETNSQQIVAIKQQPDKMGTSEKSSAKSMTAPASVTATPPLVSTVNKNTKETAAITAEKKTGQLTTDAAVPLVSIVNSETKEVAAITPEKKPEPVKPEAVAPLVAIVNSETKEVAATATEKKPEPVKPDVKSSAAIMHSEAKEVASVAAVEKSAPVNSEGALKQDPVASTKPEIVEVKAAETGDQVAAVNAKSKNETLLPLEPVSLITPAVVKASGTANAEAAMQPREKRKSRRARQESKESVSVDVPVVQLAATPEKPTMQDVIFKVQLGAFRDRTEAELKKKFEATGMKNLEYFKNSEGLLVVVTGNENDYQSATQLKETAIQHGLKDAFVVVYSGDNRLPVSMVVFEEEE